MEGTAGRHTSLDLILMGINYWRNQAICAQVSADFERISIVEIASCGRGLSGRGSMVLGMR